MCNIVVATAVTYEDIHKSKNNIYTKLPIARVHDLFTCTKKETKHVDGEMLCRCGREGGEIRWAGQSRKQ
jgi:hypothetical protein